MPESKSRNHHHQQQHHPVPKRVMPKKNGRAAMVAMVLFALLGFGFGYLTSTASIPLLAAATIIGGIAGYLLGHQIDKALTKK